MKKGYIPQEDRKKILLISDDMLATSGVGTMAKEIIVGTAHHFNWVQIAAGVNHPNHGQKLDLNKFVNEQAEIEDANVVLLPNKGYGDIRLIRQVLNEFKPDALMIFTDPRYFEWLFQIENEIRTDIPIIYYNIWDSPPAPMYNKPYYESCDALLAISKQTENINRVVLGEELSKEKVIKYVPHGINSNKFYPVLDADKLSKMQNEIFPKGKRDFVALFNSRNIRRKNIPDLLVAWKLFEDQLTDEQKSNVELILHTDAIDNNGTDLPAVCELLFGEKHNVFLSTNKLSQEGLNVLYNTADVTILPSSNEGWGLTLTESMMVGTMVIATVTGGMQDQMRFVDEKGKWMSFNSEFLSNQFGKYKECGDWAVPVFPRCSTLVGSPRTPYIWDDKIDPRDLAEAIMTVYKLSPTNRKRLGEEGNRWVLSDESGMSARMMCNNMIDGIDETFEKFVPKPKYDLIKVGERQPKKMQHPTYY